MIVCYSFTHEACEMMAFEQDDKSLPSYAPERSNSGFSRCLATGIQEIRDRLKEILDGFLAI